MIALSTEMPSDKPARPGCNSQASTDFACRAYAGNRAAFVWCTSGEATAELKQSSSLADTELRSFQCPTVCQTHNAVLQRPA